MLEPFPYPAIKRADWSACVAAFPPGWSHRCRPLVHNQGVQAKCNPASVVVAMEHARAALGLDLVTLDMDDLYERVPRSTAGTSIGDVLNESEVGVKPVGGTEDDRRFYRARWWDCGNSFDLAFTAAVYGYPLVAPGIAWRQNVRITDPDGWMLPGKGVTVSHTMYAFKPALRKVGNLIEFGLWFMQSSGAFSIKTDHCVAISENSLQGGNYYACRSVTYYRGGG